MSSIISSQNKQIKKNRSEMPLVYFKSYPFKTKVTKFESAHSKRVSSPTKSFSLLGKSDPLLEHLQQTAKLLLLHLQLRQRIRIRQEPLRHRRPPTLLSLLPHEALNLLEHFASSLVQSGVHGLKGRGSLLATPLHSQLDDHRVHVGGVAAGIGRGKLGDQLRVRIQHYIGSGLECLPFQRLYLGS